MSNPVIAIIGAGPGGAATALFLAQKGIKSIVLDKATFPRDKICGDALSGKVVEVLNRYDPNMVDQLAEKPTHLPCWGVTFVAPNREALPIPFKLDYGGETQTERAPGFIAKRLDFDNFLIEEVRRRDEIDLREGVTLKTFSKTDKGYRLETDTGDTIHADLVIACDGAHSRFAKEVGGIEVEKDHYCAGIRCYYKGVTGIREGNFIELQFIKELLPGYLWIFPLPDGGANVGLGMRSDHVSKGKINLKTRLGEIIEQVPELKERFRNAEPAESIKGYGLPLGSKKRPISGDHYMLVGDAASLIDPFTGEGIGNAMMSGMIAAEQAERCLAAADFSAKAMKEYDTVVYRRLWPELRLSRRMQQLAKFPWLFNFVVRKANRNKALREMITVMFEDIDLRDRFRKPSFYLKLLFSK